MTDNAGESAPAPRHPRVLIADDHPTMRAAIARLVGSECEVVGTVADGDVLVTEARRLAPDVVIADLFMPTLDGFAAGRQIKQELPATRLIYVTGHADSAFAAEALQIGAFALLSKISAGRELLEAIRRAMADAPSVPRGREAFSADTIRRETLPPSADPYQVLIREFASVQPNDHDSVLADLPTMRLHLNRSSFPVLATDEHGRYVVVNEAAAALTGFEVNELEAMSVADVTPPLQADVYGRLWSEFQTVGEQWGTYSLTTKNGPPTDVYYYARAHVFAGVHVSVLLPRQ